MNELVTKMSEQEMKRCPYCTEEIRAAAVKCRYCGSMLDGSRMLPMQWYRLRRGKRIAGVCAGLADYYHLPVAPLRLGAVVLALCGGWGMLLYVVLWIVMPYRDVPSSHGIPSRAADGHIY